MKTKMAIALILSILFSASATAGDIYRWTNPETGEVLATTTPPPYPIKDKRFVGRLPSGDMIELIFDSNAPEVKALIEKRKIQEAAEKRRLETEQRRIAEEKEREKQAEQRRIAEEKERERILREFEQRQAQRQAEELDKLKKEQQAVIERDQKRANLLASPSDLSQADKFLAGLPSSCSGSRVGSGGAVSIRVICDGNGKKMDGLIVIENGIITKVH